MMKKDVKIQLRFFDLDAYRHVNNSVYLNYFELARTDAYREIYDKAVADQVYIVITETYVKYKIPVLFTDTVYIRVWISDIQGVKFTVQYEVHNGYGKIFAVANTVHAMVDSATNRPLRLPKEVQKYLYVPEV